MSGLKGDRAAAILSLHPYLLTSLLPDLPNSIRFHSYASAPCNSRRIHTYKTPSCNPFAFHSYRTGEGGPSSSL